MNAMLLAPLVLALACAAVAWFLPSRLSPSVGVPVLTVSTALAAVVSVLALAQIAAAGLSEIPVVADALGWCRALYGGQHGASPIVGAASGPLLAVALVAIARQVRSARRDRRAFEGIEGLVVVDVDGPVAFAVPGRPGGVVIGRDFLRSLDRSERAVVLAHENAHLRHHHHRYVAVVESCAAGLPFLRPFAVRVRHLTERWADEDAARRVGSREIVARTIARLALLPPVSPPSAALGLGGRGIAARVHALMGPEPAVTPSIVAVLVATVATFLVAASVQVHHLVDFVHHP